MIRALLFSLLAQQRRVLGERFRARYPHCWLVWEAGLWNVTDASEQDYAITRYPDAELYDCLPAGDALCFELAPSFTRTPLSLGRASHNAFIINDATVSREHLLLRPGPEEGWQVEVLPRGGATWLEGQRLPPGQPRPLRPGTRLQLGEVRLTFHDAAGFDVRMAQVAAWLEGGSSRPAR